MTPAQRIALWADKLRDATATGLRFSENIYERERYEQLQDMMLEMFAFATNNHLRVLESLRAAVLSRPTPFSVVDTAVIHNAKILLIRRADNGLWAMPGGALEVGETPAEGAARETLEETGVQCHITKLVGVFDSRLCHSQVAHHLYHLVFLGTPIDDTAIGHGSHSHEVLDVAWFAEGNLPHNIDPGHVTRIPEAFRIWHENGDAFFDK